MQTKKSSANPAKKRNSERSKRTQIKARRANHAARPQSHNSSKAHLLHMSVRCLRNFRCFFQLISAKDIVIRIPAAVPLFRPLPGGFKTASRIRSCERASAENFDNPFPRQPYKRFWRCNKSFSNTSLYSDSGQLQPHAAFNYTMQRRYCQISPPFSIILCLPIKKRSQEKAQHICLCFPEER